ncbi:MAG TPA: KpsF/GutQ family sugar-phosphate isomerase [Syntrophales bacterium]|nr:KpsF/GutQ family sugar-phosphate isomerase [Syntrophales bacterium]
MTDSIAQGKEVLKIEAESILKLIDGIDANFSKAVEIIYKAKGRVIVTGIGKSGLVGKKIVATMTSTGTPAIFLHPVEGLHGDLGIVTRDDVMLAISNSGETTEVNTLILSVREIGLSLIAFTGNTNSTLAKSSDVVINIGVEREACPFGLAPTSSTTAALAMGDALAVALVNKMGFTKSDFYKFHPGGHLGQRLMARVRDAMIGGDNIPRVLLGTPALRAIEEMDRKNLGFIFITDKANHLLGILTDGDLRRLVRKGTGFKEKIIDDLMTIQPKTVDPGTSLAQTIELMQKDEITTLAAIDSNGHLEGYVHLHDILGRGGTIKISVT